MECIERAISTLEEFDLYELPRNPPPHLVRLYGDMDDAADRVGELLNQLRDEDDLEVAEEYCDALEVACDQLESMLGAYQRYMQNVEGDEGYESD